MSVISVHHQHKTLTYKVFSLLFLLVFTFSSGIGPRHCFAQDVPKSELDLPVPGSMVSVSKNFFPPIIKGLTIHPDNPLRFDFIVDSGDENISGEEFEREATQLIKYFLASVTIPEDELWVNLSPYEKERIIPQGLSFTEMGKDLLAQDYLLKQLTASMMYPEKEIGDKFWQNVYQKAHEQFGTTNIPVNTFNKVWVVPDKAVVYEHNGSVFVGERHLKVMLEQDYLALANNSDKKEWGTDKVSQDQLKGLSDISSQIVREIIIPEIEKEVNEGKTFAKLRQIFNSMILAVWYKKNLKESLLGQVYMDQNKIDGIEIEDKETKQKIYNQYLEAFKRGVYNYVKEDYDPATEKIIPRKYFAGGVEPGVVRVESLEIRKLEEESPDMAVRIVGPESSQGSLRKVTTDLLENEKMNGERLDLARAANGKTEEYLGRAVAVGEASRTVPQTLQEITQRIKAGEQGLEGQRIELAVQYLKEQLGERIVDGRTVGNNEIAAIVESYIRDEERTDVQMLLLEGEHTDKVIAVLKRISAMASQTMAESLAGRVEASRRIQARQADLEALVPLLKQRSAFYAAEEIELFKNQARYWKAEEEWIQARQQSDRRWNKYQPGSETLKTDSQTRQDAESLLRYARETLEPRLGDILQAFVEEAGLLGRFVNVSFRTKSLGSTMKKLQDQRGAPWYQGLAGLVDLLGGRIVVDEMKSLENVMLAVEKIIRERQDDPRFQGMRILRKENKFIANDGKADPYRAVQYTITFPGQDGEQFTFELQLKTFSSMIASDLFHNAVYKAEILGLPGDLQQTVRDYNWRSDVEETTAYLGEEAASQARAVELHYEQRVARAIEARDFNAFYDLVLSRIDERTFADKAEWIRTFDFVNAMLNKEVEFLNQLRQSRPDIIEALARASHDNGYYLTKDVAGVDGQSGVIHASGSTMLRPELSEGSWQILSEEGRRFYAGRYENFKGNNQKLTIGQLDLHHLSGEELRSFFRAEGKDVDSPEVSRLIADIESLSGVSAEQLSLKDAQKILKRPIINLYHQSFNDLLERGRTIVNLEARNKWNEAIINNQIKAVAVSVILTEIGGVDEQGRPRDLGAPAGSTSFTLREKLIHEFWVFALQYNGEYAYDGLDRAGNQDPEGWRVVDGEGRAAMNYQQFVTSVDGAGNLKFANQIHFDLTIDREIFRELATIHLKSIAESMGENRANPIRLASLQRARAEIIAKYIKSLVPAQRLAIRITDYLDQKFGIESDILLRGNGGAEEVRESIVQSAERNDEQRALAVRQLAQHWQKEGTNADQATAMDVLTPLLGIAGLTETDVIELDRVIRAEDKEAEDTTQDDIRFILEEASRRLEPHQVQKIQKAITLALEIHAGQPRAADDARPYSVHLAGVVKGLVFNLKIFNLIPDKERSSDIVAAAFLHDAIEDVNNGDYRKSLSRELSEMEVKRIVADRIRGEINERVLSIVQELSKPLLSKTAVSSQAAEAEYIRSLQGASIEAQMIKVLDWWKNFGDLANVPAANRQWTARFVQNRLEPILEFLKVTKVHPLLSIALLDQILRSGRMNNNLNRTIAGAQNILTLTEKQELAIDAAKAEIAGRVEQRGDAAGEGDFTKGGIDFNPALLDLQVRRDGNGVPLPTYQQPIHKMRIDGFFPVIINVTPVTVPMLLGEAEVEEEAKYSLTSLN